MKRGYQQDLFGYLFGNVLAISSAELFIFSVVSVGVLGVLALIFRELLFASFDEEIARAYGHRVDLLNAILLFLVAVTIVMGVRLVGVLLVQALLVIPAAAAALWMTHYRGQLLLSTLLGAGCGAAGLALAYEFDVAAGGSIVLVATAVFFVSLLLRSARA